jgi:methyl-accepting chemotaxis protein
MPKLRSMRLSWKMPLFVTGMCLVMAVGLASLTYFPYRAKTVSDETFNLSVIAQQRSERMKAWVDDVSAETLLLAHNPQVIAAMTTFEAAWAKIEGSPQTYVQTAYVTNNPNPIGERYRLDRASDGTDYSAAHGLNHPFLLEFQQVGQFYDVFLINPAGDVVYSVFKEADLGANLTTGSLSTSGLANAFRQALEGSTDTSYFSDFAPYAPSGGVVAGFSASAIKDRNGRIIGVVALQLNMDTFNAVLTDTTGLGITTQVYAVAQDMTLRSNSRLEGGPVALDKIEGTPHIAAALGGEMSDLEGITGLSGASVIAHARPFDFGQTRWAIVTEMEETEVIAHANQLGHKLALTSIFATALISLLGWLYVRTVTNAISRVRADMTRMAEGSFDVQIADAGRGDEIGDIGKVLADFRDRLIAADEANQEQANKRHEQQKVVAALSEGLVNLSEGNLTLPIADPFEPEYEKLRLDFNKTLTTLNSTMSEVIVAAGSIKHGAVEISQAADDLSNRTENQAATLEETAAALDELTASVRSAASGAKSVEQIVSEARTDAEHSGTVVQNAVAAMTEIEKSSEHISQIVGVIEDIAFQTNLLALNAGVEAARAGDAGKGFAVVASEVRALAQRSSEAAKEIKTLIRGSSQQVERGVDLVGKAGDALKHIVQRVAHISNLMSEMATGAAEQATGLNEINIGVTQLDQVTQQNAAMVEQATAASHNLNKDAERLTMLMERFRTDGGWGQDSGRGTAYRDSDRLSSGSDLSFGEVNVVPIAVNGRAPARAVGAAWQDF